MSIQENDKVLLSAFTPEQVEAAFHVSVKNFLTKKQQGMTMGAFRDALAMSSSTTAVEQRNKLRTALVGVIGASTREELDALELGVRTTPSCGEDRAVVLNAIHALRDTAEAS